MSLGLLKVFVSSTTDDLKPYRTEVGALIRDFKFEDVLMDRWTAEPDPPLVKIERAIRDCDVYVGLIGHKYGTHLPGQRVSYIHHEYSYAGECGKPRLLYLRDESCPLSEGDPNRTPIIRLRNKIKKGHLWKEFTKPLDLVRKVSASLFELWSSGGIPKYDDLPPEKKILLELRRLASDDLLARRDQLENSQDVSKRSWFFGPLRRCNVGPKFSVPRVGEFEKVAAWLLSHHQPCIALTGPSGIGKTNFLVELMDRIGQDPPPLQLEAVLPLSLGAYAPEESFADNLKRMIPREGSAMGPSVERDLLELVRNGKVLLFLDGLDEFARNYSAEQCVDLFRELLEILDPVRSKVVITCRDHIYRRLRGEGAFKHASRIHNVPVEQLTVDEATTALGHRLGKDSAIYHAVTSNPRLADFSCNPLLLEMMCQIDRESWKKFAKDQTRGKLYDLWFEEIIAAGSEKDTMLTGESIDETRTKVEAVARIMLQTRRDLVARAVIDENKVPIERLRTPDTRPFGIFVEEAKDEWGFVHGSFREFTLAKTIEAELKAANYDLIANYDQFDYVGAELLLFLRDLFPKVDDLLGSYERAIRATSANPAVWDKVLWNAFDTVGNVGTDSAERFIDTAMEILRPGAGLTASVSLRTQYNIVRCIERLHCSAPRPYCEYVIKRSLSRQAYWEEFGAFAIRGFHVDLPQPGYFPPVYYRWTRNTSDNRRQKEVSDFLLRLIENTATTGPDSGETYLEINTTFALIRWLHEEDISRARDLLRMKPNGGDLSPMSWGNVFQAFLRFREPEVFAGCDPLFEGMHLAYCAIEPSMLPADFVFRRVRFYEHRRSKIDGLVLDNRCALA